jgi:hypothetical protein
MASRCRLSIVRVARVTQLLRSGTAGQVLYVDDDVTVDKWKAVKSQRYAVTVVLLLIAMTVRPVLTLFAVKNPEGNPCQPGSQDLCVIWRAEADVSGGEEVCNGYATYMLQDRALLQYGFLQVRSISLAVVAGRSCNRCNHELGCTRRCKVMHLLCCGWHRCDVNSCDND